MNIVKHGKEMYVKNVLLVLISVLMVNVHQLTQVAKHSIKEMDIVHHVIHLSS